MIFELISGRLLLRFGDDLTEGGELRPELSGFPACAVPPSVKRKTETKMRPLETQKTGPRRTIFGVYPFVSRLCLIAVLETEIATAVPAIQGFSTKHCESLKSLADRYLHCARREWTRTFGDKGCQSSRLESSKNGCHRHAYDCHHAH